MDPLTVLFARNGLDTPGKRVLIVEDLRLVLLGLREALESAGHNVTTALGVDMVEDGIAAGPGEGGSVHFDLREFDCAFFDHYFMSRSHNGRTLTLEMRRVNAGRIIGMSSSASANRAMVAAGATEYVAKTDLIRMLGL